MNHRGMALLIVMMVFLVVAAGTSYMLNRSGNLLESARSASRKETLAVQTKSRIFEIQSKIRTLMNGQICQRDRADQNLCNPNAEFDYSSLSPEEGEGLSIRCVAQGAPPVPGCTIDSQRAPKLVEVKLTKESLGSDEIVSIFAELMVDFIRLNDFAYLVIREPTNKIVFGANDFAGKVGAIFANVVPGDLTNPSTTRLQFANRANEDLKFQKVLMTNVPIQQIDRGIPRTYNPLVYWYPTKEPVLAAGVYPNASPPTDIYESFQHIASGSVGPNNEEVIRYNGTFQVQSAEIRLGGETPEDRCKIHIQIMVPPNSSCIIPGRNKAIDPFYQNLRRMFDDLIRFDLQAEPVFFHDQAATALNCEPAPEAHDLVPLSTQADNKIYVIDSASPIKITSVQSGHKYGSVCKNFTIIANAPVEFQKSIVRKSSTGGGTPQDSEANVALVNLGHSNLLPKTARPMAPISAADLEQLKSLCHSTDSLGRCTGATSFKPAMDTSFEIEMSLLAFSNSDDPLHGASALKVSEELIAINTPGMLGGLKIKGLFVADRMTANKSITLSGWPPNPTIQISGFNFTKFIYPLGLQNYPPPGIKEAQSNLPMEAWITSLQVSISNLREAQRWASNLED